MPVRTTVQSGMLLNLVLCCGCCALFSSAALHAQSAAKAGRCYVLSIQGMSCEECAVHVQKALEQVAGVAEAKLSYAKAEASVCTKPGSTVTGETLVKAVKKAGYKAKVKWQSQD